MLAAPSAARGGEAPPIEGTSVWSFPVGKRPLPWERSSRLTRTSAGRAGCGGLPPTTQPSARFWKASLLVTTGSLSGDRTAGRPPLTPPIRARYFGCAAANEAVRRNRPVLRRDGARAPRRDGGPLPRDRRARRLTPQYPQQPSLYERMPCFPSGSSPPRSEVAGRPGASIAVLPGRPAVTQRLGESGRRVGTSADDLSRPDPSKGRRRFYLGQIATTVDRSYAAAASCRLGPRRLPRRERGESSGC